MKKRDEFIEQLFIVLGYRSIKNYHGRNKEELIEIKKEHDKRLKYLATLTAYEKACQNMSGNFKLGSLEERKLGYII